MSVTYYGSTISPNMDKTPEGYLICRNVPINRTGVQEYTSGELGLGGEERMVQVYRLEEDVFSPAALASLEGKDVTRGHPPEMLTAENQAGYSKGHIENVRREGENTVADLIIKDPALVSDVESGVLREVSCGYYCNFQPYQDGYRQTDLVGNHVAVVPRGRAGRDVAIKDAAEAEKGLKHMKKETKEAFLRFLGLAARDAEPEELERLSQDASAVLDAGPAVEAQEAAPTEDAMVEEPKGDDIGSKLDRILAMLEAKARGGEGEHRLHDEGDIDAAVDELAATTVQAGDKCTGPARDAAVELLRKMRPVVAGIEDRAVRSRVTDALLSVIREEDNMEAIAKAATDSAQVAAQQTSKTTYEKMCADSESAYAARNPHKKEG